MILLLSSVGEALNFADSSSLIHGMGPDNEDVLWQSPSDFECFNSLGAYPQCVINNSHVRPQLTDKCR